VGTASLYARSLTWAATSETVRRWRERRYRLFLELCEVGRADPGRGRGQGCGARALHRTNPIVAVDLKLDTSEWLSAPNVDARVADGTKLEFGDGEFPLVFSSSTIEYVPKELQEAFASPIRLRGERRISIGDDVCIGPGSLLQTLEGPGYAGTLEIGSGTRRFAGAEEVAR
jgi:hypothetical protein